VGHGGEVRDDGPAERVAAEGHGQGRLRAGEALVLQEIAQGHRRGRRVGDLEAETGLAGDGSEHAHLAAEREREIVVQTVDLGRAGAGGGRQLVGGDGRPGEGGREGAVHAEVLEGPEQEVRGRLEPGVVAGLGRRGALRGQEVQPQAGALGALDEGEPPLRAR